MIDTISEPGSWARAFARGCLTETVAQMQSLRRAALPAHPDPVFAGIIPASDAHATTSEAR
jgi:hypothetical protein